MARLKLLYFVIFSKEDSANFPKHLFPPCKGACWEAVRVVWRRFLIRNSRSVAQSGNNVHHDKRSLFAIFVPVRTAPEQAT